jgi:hypothetical protein
LKKWQDGGKEVIGSFDVKAGLPDGLFFKPKIQIWVNFEGFAKEDVGIFY